MIEIERLVGREEIVIPDATIERAVSGKIVLVTGAGGSIGSELCRQMARGKPAKLVLVGHSEFPLFSIQRELNKSYPDLKVVGVLADIRDCHRMISVFHEHTPEIAIHAAAIKHVPMAEQYPCEAALTNIIGSDAFLQACDEVNCEGLMVSTDKAVYPNSVMGMTKRVAEYLFHQFPDTRVVRFGNVLGSSGSVIPIFEEIIADRGVFKITHPEITRYFMTIPEAASLILMSLSYPKGFTYILDMGEPVKITSLAMIMMEEAGVELPVEFIGLREGEKINEDLMYKEEMAQSRDLLAMKQSPYMFKKHSIPLPQLLDDIELLAHEGNDEAVKALLKDVTEGY